jgi:aldehyde dehydrogenase (NAD+)
VLVQDRLFVGGEWVAPSTAATIDVVSPMTEEVVARVPEAAAADVERAVAAARAAFDRGPWPRTPPAERAEVLERAAALLHERRAELAGLITLEMGSPALFSQFVQVPVPVRTLRSTARLAREFPFQEERGNRARSLLVQEPVGVVAAIVPWNTPLLVTMAKVAPALAAGCTVVVKPAPESPLDANVMAEAFAAAGLPPGVLSVLPAGREVGEHLVRHPGVDKVAFTGSTAAGRRIAALCGERLARVSLELGGKSAAIVLDDAPLEATVAGLLPLAFVNSGQACVAQTRVLVSRRRHDEFVEAFAEAAAAQVVGDPSDTATVIGPLAAARQRERVEGYIALAQDEGAKVVTGGGRPASQPTGWFVEPTVLTGVRNDMRVAREEVFGPVVAVLAYDEPDDAVAIADDSDYGLAGSVWTADVDAGVDVARRVRTGTYSVNGAPQAADAPFGGFKASGIGREFGPEGLRLYLETKSIAVPAPSRRPARGEESA